MSIVVFPPQSGAASIADATNTTAGKIRIATSGESTAGTNTVTAMTPALVQAKINAAVSGGVEYKGSFNAATATPSLVTALKGDLYLVSHAGTFAGIALNVNDHIVFNQNAADPVTASMFDVIDNTSDTSLQKSQNLGDLDNLGQAQTNLGLGTAALKSTGTSADNVVLLDGSAKIPAIDGSLLTNITTSASNITGLGTAAVKDTGTSAGNVVLLDGSAKIPAIDGSLLTNVVADLVNDTSPQLGGNLDVNSNDIVSVSNGAINLAPNGNGQVTIKGNATGGPGQLKLNCENNSHGITIKGPPHSAAASYTLTLPNDDGDADQVLKTDGSGNLDWVDQSGGSTPKLNEIATGDAASELKTTVGDITINANANNSDIILKGNDNSTPFTMLTLDGSEQGDAAFNRDISLGGDLVLTGASKAIKFESGEVALNHRDGSGLTVDMASSEGANEPLFELKHTATDSNGPTLDLWNNGISSGNIIVGTMRTKKGVSTSDITSQMQTYWNTTTTLAKTRFSVRDSGTLNHVLELSSDGSSAFYADINGTLKIGGTAITSTASELNILDGVTATASELNILDGVTATASEINLLDGGTAVGGSITIADADGFIINDNGTMKTVPASDVKTYAGGGGGGASKPAVTAIASGDFTANNYTITTYTGIEEVFLMSPNATSTVTLTAAATVGAGYKYNIKLLTAQTLTVTRAGSDTIDGATTFAISAQYGTVTLMSDGTNWHII